MASVTATRPGPIVPPGLLGINKHNRARLVVAVLLAFVSLAPLLYMVSLSFQPVGDILTPNLVLLPTHPTVSNYVQAWTENSFARYFMNSLIVTVSTVVITMVLASLAAFAFARYRFPFREVIFYLLLASLTVPGLILLIPQYLLLQRLHLLDSLQGLTLLYVSTNLPFTIFFLRGFFERIPKEYEEAFRLEGAGTLRVLTRLIMPLSLPALAVVSMFTFNGVWDDFPTALTMLNSPQHFTLAIGLQFFIGVHTTAFGPFFAASVIATIPTLIVLAMSLRWFRSGVSLGGIR